MKLDTPCIGICSTVYGDEICRGCKRIYTEVIAWNTYNDGERQRIFNRLTADIVQVMQDKIAVIDMQCLEQQLIEQNIRYSEDQPPLCWAYHLLRVGSESIHSLAQYGLSVKSSYQNYTLRQLFTLLDAELLQLAQSKQIVALNQRPINC